MQIHSVIGAHRFKMRLKRNLHKNELAISVAISIILVVAMVAAAGAAAYVYVNSMVNVQESVPRIFFTKEDLTNKDQLTVTSTDSTAICWEDLEFTANGIPIEITNTDTISAGDVIDIGASLRANEQLSSYEGKITINIGYKQTNTLLGSYEFVVTVDDSNTPPETPYMPFGPTHVFIGYEHDYSSSTTDAESHPLYYEWDWGDETRGWYGPITSGSLVYAGYSWGNCGDFEVKVKVKDDPNGDGDLSDGLESSWSGSFSVRVLIIGDLDDDGDVDLSDLAQLLANWGKTSGATWNEGDIDGDGDVDNDDLNALIDNYGYGT